MIIKNRRRRVKVMHGPSLITDSDVYLFKEGTHCRLYDKLGAHPAKVKRRIGTHFAVWAPNAEKVSVLGDFNGWDRGSHPLAPRWDASGIWEGFVPGVSKGDLYKYHITSRHNRYSVDKGDPFAFFWEISPRTASIVWDLDHEWHDAEWMQGRAQKNSLRAPMSVYEVHLGSWKRQASDNYRSLHYKELADQLVAYVKKMGFTHVEFLPVMEHPFFGSWGYQTAGYFAPSSRYGEPQELMQLIDVLHQNGIGVILDWVPSHFPSDQHGLAFFDGTHLFEHSDPRQGFHPDWNSYIFNYGRREVQEFLISSAVFWLDKYHVDGLRIDAVASMLYLDYSRKEGEWVPNQYGGRENLDAIDFLKKLNSVIYQEFPDVQTIAEESTAWPMVTRPAHVGGLGFGMKWDMGWMHDTLLYISKDPVHRKYHQDQLTFSIWYAFSENFMLPLSHDEVVHGKGSLLGKMPGDDWQKFANLRLLYGYMYAHPAKKLLFMGGELGQWNEWNHDAELSWDLLQHSPHQGIQKWVRDLNSLYKQEPRLFEQDFEQAGFEWIDCSDYTSSVIIFLRKAATVNDPLLAVCNFTPVFRKGYRIGVPLAGLWQEILNSDALDYGGSGKINPDGVNTENIKAHGRPQSLVLDLPPLGIMLFKPKRT
ncbi:MAG: 1,4-alpha-glucan branching protein GlgB [Candidatus Saganbacteria bacterium]|nr:1,4-alpha-glucan branching protein GlgB [Candidatus Saganbacteria bacterium]